MPDERMARTELVRRLGMTVGAAKAQHAIDAAALALGLRDPTLDAIQCAALLDHLGANTDIVGIAARLLKVQLTLAAAGPRGGPTGAR